MLDKNADYVVTAYGYFESKLRDACAQLAGISGPLDAAEARKMLKHHANAKFPDDRIWQELMMLKKIRNALTSSAGRIEERNLLEFARKRGIITEDASVHRIEITDDYKDLVRRTIIEFFDGFQALNDLGGA